jgi:glycosyltransferase involved in cell wall biosynthesis
VKLVGDLHPSLIPSAIRSSDVIVAPSLAEGFGLGVVEAMLLGTPVIVSRVGGLQQVVEDGATGVFVEPGNAPELGRALQELWGSPATSRRLAGAAEAAARERFSAERMAKETAQVYAALVGGCPSRVTSCGSPAF